MPASRKRTRGGIIQTPQQRADIQRKEDLRLVKAADAARARLSTPPAYTPKLSGLAEWLKSNPNTPLKELKGGSIRSRRKRKGGAIIKGHLVSKVSHKNRNPSRAYDAARDTFLDMPDNPLPVSGNKRKVGKGVLDDEMSTSLHLKR